MQNGPRRSVFEFWRKRGDLRVPLVDDCASVFIVLSPTVAPHCLEQIFRWDFRVFKMIV